MSNHHNLLDKQIAALRCFRSGALLSAHQLADRLCVIRSNAELRIDELRDKGMLRKNNGTQFSITTKGVTVLNAIDRQDAPETLFGEAVSPAREKVAEPVQVTEKVIEVAEVAPKPEVEPAVIEVRAFSDQTAEAVNHEALQAIRRLQDALTKPKPIEIKDLELKKEVLCQLARILDHSITDVLVNICDDLDRAAGKEL